MASLSKIPNIYLQSLRGRRTISARGEALSSGAASMEVWHFRLDLLSLAVAAAGLICAFVFALTPT